MLGRILNINAEYSGSGNNKRKGAHFLHSDPEERPAGTGGSDTLKLSPAAVFFLRLNIFLKEYSRDEKDEYSLRFNVGKYQILTNVSAAGCLKSDYQLYKISDYEKLSDKFKKSTVDLLVSPGLIIELEGSRPFVLEYFDSLFGRVKDLNLRHSLDRTESYAIGALLDGYYEDFVKEISKINTAVFSFIDKSNGTSFTSELPKIKIAEPPVVIDKISTSQL